MRIQIFTDDLIVQYMFDVLSMCSYKVITSLFHCLTSLRTVLLAPRHTPPYSHLACRLL